MVGLGDIGVGRNFGGHGCKQSRDSLAANDDVTNPVETARNRLQQCFERLAGFGIDAVALCHGVALRQECGGRSLPPEMTSGQWIRAHGIDSWRVTSGWQCRDDAIN